jgi:hypothetical protein
MDNPEREIKDVIQNGQSREKNERRSLEWTIQREKSKA